MDGESPSEPSGSLVVAQAAATTTLSSHSAASQIASAVAGRNSRGIEDAILRVEAKLPGLGGLSLDSAGNLVAYLLPPNDQVGVRKTVVATLRKALAAERQVPQEFSEVHVRTGQFLFSQLVEWQQEMWPHLRGMRHVITIDANEARNRLGVLLRDPAGAPAVLAVARRLGAPESAIEFNVESWDAQLVQANIRGTFRPTRGGVQIKMDNFSSTDHICTAGFNVTDPQGRRLMLTAAHCWLFFSYQNGGTGAEIWQPCCQLNIIGAIRVNPPFFPCGIQYCTDADAMLIEHYSSIASNKQLPAVASPPGTNSAGGSISRVGWWSVGPPGVAMMGDSVDKMGHVTGWTRGRVDLTCVPQTAKYVQNGVPVDSIYTFCVNRVAGARAGGGDSGGAVFFRSSLSTKTPLGIVVAANNVTTIVEGGKYTICTSGCSFTYSAWSTIETALGMTLTPH